MVGDNLFVNRFQRKCTIAPISFKLIVLDQKSIQSIRREAFIVGSNTFSFLSSCSLNFVIFGWEPLQQSRIEYVGDLCSGYIHSESLKKQFIFINSNCDPFLQVPGVRVAIKSILGRSWKNCGLRLAGGRWASFPVLRNRKGTESGLPLRWAGG